MSVAPSSTTAPVDAMVRDTFEASIGFLEAIADGYGLVFDLEEFDFHLDIEANPSAGVHGASVAYVQAVLSMLAWGGLHSFTKIGGEACA